MLVSHSDSSKRDKDSSFESELGEIMGCYLSVSPHEKRPRFPYIGYEKVVRNRRALQAVGQSQGKAWATIPYEAYGIIIRHRIIMFSATSSLFVDDHLSALEGMLSLQNDIITLTEPMS